ncbi:MAG: peptide-methionine (S)-S-oxide reductase MsrA [Planctomycetota bacterium]
MAMGITGASCVRADVKVADVPDPAVDLEFSADAGPQTAIFAGGCFWCTEAVFERVEGVSDVVSGYIGGTKADANYGTVSNGLSDHAEAIRISYDPAAVSYGTLLKVFFTVAHDPTQLNRQGPDVGRHYRSAVFYQSDDEKGVAQAYIDQLTEAGVFGDPIVTTLEPFGEGFYVAEEYHQDYAEANPGQPYIVFQAQPKVAKLEKAFPDLLDDE